MQPVPFFGHGYVPSMAAPFIGVHIFRQSGFQWISVDISNRLQEVAVCVGEYGFIPPPEKLAVKVVSPIVSLSVNAV